MLKRTFQVLLAALVLGVTVALTLVTQPLAGSDPRDPTPMPVSPVNLKAHVKFLSVDVHPRGYQHAANLEAAANYIEQQFIAMGAKPISQPVVADGANYRNLIVRFGPTTGDTIVVGAHYDSHCHDTPCTPGADDNASGVAGLLELARLLIKSPPKQPVELVAYTLEEPEYFRSDDMGSAWHAKSMVDAKRPIKLMMSLEMIGTFLDGAKSQHYPIPGMQLLYPSTGNFIGVVGKLSHFGNSRRIKALMSGASALPVYSINAPTWIQGIDFSDHVSYWDLDLPAVMVTDTAFMRNIHYHQAGDTYDKLDYVRMAQVVTQVYAVVQHF